MLHLKYAAPMNRVECDGYILIEFIAWVLLMLKLKTVDIIGGPLFRSILIYAIPIILGSFIQVAFNAADLIFRLVWLWFIYPNLDAMNHTIVNVYLCYTVSWFIALIAHTTVFIIIYSSYLKGRLKKI